MPPQSVLRNVIQAKSTVGPATPQTAALDDRQFEPPPAAPQPAEVLEAPLGILVDNAPVALAMFDQEMRYLVANRLWVEEFGLQHVRPLTGRSQYDVFPGLHPGWRQVYDRALQGHVVRSEHDAMSGLDGKPIIYRWVVRPWRRSEDAAVAGVMISCEKFSDGLAPADAATEPASSGANANAEAVASQALFQSSVAALILTPEGVIQSANQAATTLALARGMSEGASYFWEAFSDGHEQTALRERTLDAIAALHEENHGVQTVIACEQAVAFEENAAVPHQWMLARSVGADAAPAIIAIALPPAPMQEIAPQTIKVHLPGSAPVAATAPETDASTHAELERARQEISLLREAEAAFTRREVRQRAVLEALGSGLLVLDERGSPIYHNEQAARLLGRGIQRGESVEQWLMQACPTAGHRAEVARVWSQDVWSRQLTRTLSLTAADGALKEVEFRPASMNGGGVLISLRDVSDTFRAEELLRSTEAKFRALLQETSAAVLLVDKSGAVFDANAAAEQLLGRSKAELRRLDIEEWLTAESAAARKEALRLMREEGRRSAEMNAQLRLPGGAQRAARLRIAVVADGDGRPHCTMHLLDAADSIPAPTNKATGQATASPASPSNATAAQSAVRWLLQTDVNGRITTWSPDAEQVFGISAVDATGRWLHSLFRPSDPSGFYAELQTRLENPRESFEWSFFGGRNGRGTATFHVKATAEAGNGVDLFERQAQASNQGAADIGQTTSAPATSLAAPPPLDPHTHIVKPSQLWPVADLDREKLLLSETHHRIKNHLQIISSMLNLQLNTLTDTGARAALRSSQNRVRSIAALHQHLYHLALGEGATFDEMAHGLAHRLRECYDVPEGQVALNLQIAGGVIQQEWMMPLTLILNETLSNAFEHAFPNGQHGTVSVRLSLGDGTGEFEVSDDGVGLPEGFDPAMSPGLGLKILGVFADQMHGELRLTGSPGQGTKFNLRFPMAYVDN